MTWTKKEQTEWYDDSVSTYPAEERPFRELIQLQPIDEWFSIEEQFQMMEDWDTLT